jgi:hypothetical protein
LLVHSDEPIEICHVEIQKALPVSCAFFIISNRPLQTAQVHIYKEERFEQSKANTQWMWNVVQSWLHGGAFS